MILDYCNKGLPIVLDISTQEIVYKDNRVLFDNIKRASESGLDRIQLSKDLTYTRSFGFVEFGCLSLSEEKVKHLIKKVCNRLK